MGVGFASFQEKFKRRGCSHQRHGRSMHSEKLEMGGEVYSK